MDVVGDLRSGQVQDAGFVVLGECHDLRTMRNGIHTVRLADRFLQRDAESVRLRVYLRQGASDTHEGRVELVQPLIEYDTGVAVGIGGDEHRRHLRAYRGRYHVECRRDVGHRRRADIRAVGVAEEQQGDLSRGPGSQIERGSGGVRQIQGRLVDRLRERGSA